MGRLRVSNVGLALGVIAVVGCGCATVPAHPKTRAAVNGHATKEPCPTAMPAPHMLPGAKPEHRQAGFWIERLSAPDDEVLGPSEIASLNERGEGLWKQDDFGFRRDLLASPIDTAAVLRDVKKAVGELRDSAAKGGKVLLDGARPPEELFAGMERLIAAAKPAGELRVAYEPVPMRCHPVEEGLYESAGDKDFDLMLCSTLRPGEVVRVVSSHPGGWLLVRSEYAYGWSKLAGLSAPIDEPAAARYLRPEQSVVVTTDRAPVWSSREKTKQLIAASLGLELPLAGPAPAYSELLQVLAPGPTGLVSGWVEAGDVHVGPLALTRRNVVRYALRQLDASFGWGDSAGDRDCSRFLMDLFALFGLRLPRNSQYQAQAGSWVVDLTKLSVDHKLVEIEHAAQQGLVLLYMPGHIMLLLGQDRGEPYAVHEFSSYRVACDTGHDIKMMAGRVAVTNLHLGEGSERRSFIERLAKLIVIGRREGQ